MRSPTLVRRPHAAPTELEPALLSPGLNSAPLQASCGREDTLGGPLLRSRIPLGVLAGVCLAAAFPKLGITGLAWIAPALMLAAALGKRGGEAFRIGYVAGLTFYLVSLYWLLLIPYRWHGIPLGPAAGWLGLSAYLALFSAAWVWLMAGGPRARGRRPKSEGRNPKAGIGRPQPPTTGHAPQPSPLDPRPSTLALGTSDFGFHPSPFLSRTWLGRTAWALCGAAIWVALEIIMARFLGGFPWEPLGVSRSNWRRSSKSPLSPGSMAFRSWSCGFHSRSCRRG